MIRTSFSTLSCPDWSWYDLLEFGSRYGYDGVEIRLIERKTDLLALAEFQPNQLEIRRRELAEANFCVCGLASSVRFDDPSEAERAKQVDIGKAYIDLAAELGASFVRVFGDTLPAGANADERERAMANIAEGLQRLGGDAGETGLRVVIETHGDFAVSAIVEETLTLVDSSAVGVLWDTHHPWRFHSEELSATFDRLRPWIRHTHWKDSVIRPRHTDEEAVSEAAIEAHALMSGHRHADYVLFGGGEFPALKCMRLLRKSGYDGWFSLEWEKMWHPEIEDPEIALPLFPAKIRELSQLADLLND